MKSVAVSPRPRVRIPLFDQTIQAGFPSPADDVQERPIDLNEYLIKNQAATFLVRVSGESMIGAGIFPDDVLVVDKSLTPKSGDVIVAVHDGEFTVKRFVKTSRGAILQPENKAFEPIVITQDSDFQVWGTVTCVLHNPNTL